ncbi:MAG: DNA primase [bacterium]
MMYNSQKNFQSQDIINEIKNRLDIVDTVSEYVVLKKAGKNFWGLCPFHQEKSPSFSVNPEKGIFKCFGCGEGGDSISFLMKINKHTFYEVIVDLAQKFGLKLPSYEYSSEKNELKKKIYEINLRAANYYTNLLLEEKEGQKAKDYLFKRDIDRQTIQKFNIGYSLRQSDSLINYLIDNYKINLDLMEKAGLVSKRTDGNGYCDRFRNRIIIPIQDENGNITAFGARALEDSQSAKYLNSPETLVFNKSRSLFAVYQAKDSIKSLDSVIIMEGYFDVISAHTHGLTNVVATLGTALTEQHLKIIARYTNSRRIYLAFDADEAGINATNRGAEVIRSVFERLGDIKQFDENFAVFSGANDRSSCEIKVITTLIGKDPDEFIRTEGIDAYKKLINQALPLIDYQINEIIKSKGNFDSPQSKFSLVKELMPVLVEIKNPIIRDEYIRLISEKFGINEESFAIEIKKSLQNVKYRKNIKPVIKRDLNKHVLAQKNLLSLYFMDGDNLSSLCINSYLKEVNFTEPVFLLIKNEIEEVIKRAKNVEELTKELFTRFIDNEEVKKIIVDIIFSLEDKKYLDTRLLKEYINENIVLINQYVPLQEQDQLKQSYHSVKDDEVFSLQLQYKVKEFIQSNRIRLEIVNEQKNEE